MLSAPQVIRSLMAVVLGGVFILDALTPLGIVSWLLYLVPVWGTFWYPHRRAPMIVAIACSIFIVIGYFISPPGAYSLAMVVANRTLGAMTLIITAALVYQLKRHHEAIGEAAATLERRVEARTAELAHANRTLHEESAAHKQTADDLSKQTMILESILSSLGEGVIVADMNGKFLIWNPAAARIIGLGPTTSAPEAWQQTYGVYLPDQVTPYPTDDLPLVKAIRGISVDGDEQFLRHAGCPDGLWLNVNGRPVFDALGAPLGGVVVVRDVTSRKRQDDAMAWLAAIVDHSDDAVIGCFFDGTVTSWNAAAERMYGYLAAEVVGKTIDFLIPTELIEEERRMIERVRKGDGAAHLETVRRRKDGEDIQVSLTISPVIDRKGKRIGISKITRDISEQKRTEEAIKQHAEAVSGLNKELEAFSYSVSHDLRAPLRHVDGFVDLLQRHAHGSLDDKGRRYLRTISDSAKQMGRLVDDLLAFSRMGRTDMRESWISLDAVVHDALQTVQTEAPTRRIDWILNKLPDVQADPDMLRVVFVNLLANAEKYTRTRAHASIEVGASETAEEAIVFVRDNGVGFDMTYAHKLFGVFQRLHSAKDFEGTGIGLANVRRIIARHGGRTWAEGAVNEGAIFYFSLPRKGAQCHDGVEANTAGRG
jgi:PAS domain S-box-containing protein